MSADFSIRPAGVPAASPVVRPAPDAAREAVETQLPADRSVTAAERSLAGRNDADNGQKQLSRDVVLDRDAAEIVYRIVDSRTESVVHQVPDEAKVRARAYFRELERHRQSQLPTPLTDRWA